MSGRYFTEDKLDLRSLRHDLRGVIAPLAVGISAMKSGSISDGLMLQDEVLKKLKNVLGELDKMSEQPKVMVKE